MKKLLLIDTFNFLHRAYFALPKTLTDSDGNPTNAIYGTTSMLISIFQTLKPDYAVAALDSKKPTFRVEDFTGYKAHRRPMEDDLSQQIPKIFEVIDAFGVKSLTVDGYEADDIIGTMVEKTKDEDIEVIIASNDKDLWQLINDKVLIMIPSTKGSADLVGMREAEARLGFNPELLVEYKALRGDPSDNIPGVYGIGDKTAKNLIEVYGSVEGIYNNIDQIHPVKLKEKLLNNYEEAIMSKKLATIIRDVPMDVNLNECYYSDYNAGEVKKVLEKYRFKSLIKRLGFTDYNGPDEGKSVEVNDNQMSLF